MNVASLLVEARTTTGLSDFGNENFLTGLRHLLDAADDIPLNPGGREALHQSLVHRLVNRTHIECWYSRNPKIEDTRIERPLFVFGLPRSGTSATVSLLALDPQFRYFRRWEGQDPLPPPPPIGMEGDDPRLARAIATSEGRVVSKIHISEPNGPEEEMSAIGGLNFHGYEGSLPTPDRFIQWWIDADMSATYIYHRRILRLLQSNQPHQTWLLKSNPHLFHLHSLLAVYPDARFIMTHRDPRKTIASLASMSLQLFRISCDDADIDKQWVGRRCLNFWSIGMRRALAARREIGEDRFADISNRILLEDPVGTLKQAYERSGLIFGPDAEANILRFQADNPPNKHGTHTYSLDEFGITDAMIADGFHEYIEAYQGYF